MKRIMVSLDDETYGVILIFPLLPDAVADIVVDLQQRISETEASFVHRYSFTT